MKPAGIESAGRPVVALSWQVVPICASPMSVGLRRSVGYTSTSNFWPSSTASTAARNARRFTSACR